MPVAPHAQERNESVRVRYASLGRISSVGLIETVVTQPGPRLVFLNTVQSAAVVARKMHDAGHTVSTSRPHSLQRIAVRPWTS